MEGCKALLDDVLNATDEEFEAYYPLFSESQTENTQRLRFVQSVFDGKNPSKTLSSSEKSKNHTKTETKVNVSPSLNANVETAINYSNREGLFERRQDIETVYGMWNISGAHLATVGGHHSSPGGFQGQIALPEHVLSTPILTQGMSQASPEAPYTGFGGTDAVDRDVLHEGLINDSVTFSRSEGDDEDYLQRYISSFEASSFQEVG